ncbi:MAG: hypothetical protein RRY95_02760 [Oscillospiraceae bacterium]
MRNAKETPVFGDFSLVNDGILQPGSGLATRTFQPLPPPEINFSQKFGGNTGFSKMFCYNESTAKKKNNRQEGIFYESDARSFLSVGG